MRILFDQGTPAPLRQSLTAHTVSTAYEMGWSALSNGDLIDAAEAQFDVFVTTDQNLNTNKTLPGGGWRFWSFPMPVGQNCK